MKSSNQQSMKTLHYSISRWVKLDKATVSKEIIVFDGIIIIALYYNKAKKM